MKSKKNGFTLIELLLVLMIITLLVALLIPSLAMIRRLAKETKQKAQLNSIDMALLAFKNDQGYYPPSGLTPPVSDYSGAQMLAEALLGWDLLGFHPDSTWRADGLAYEPPDPSTSNLEERRGPYLEVGTANAFRLGNNPVENKPGLFDDTTPLAPDTFVLCDVFGKKQITLPSGKIVKAGTPILYYRANTTRKTIDSGFPDSRIYNVLDNDDLVGLVDDYVSPRYLADPTPGLGGMYQYFYDYITDPKITARKWPYKPDSYILITAGADGLYGTADDICNFDN